MKTGNDKNIFISFDDSSQMIVSKETTLHDLLKLKCHDAMPKIPIIAAKINYILRELRYPLKEDCYVRFIDLAEEDGMRIYRRSLYFIYIKALKDIFPEMITVLSHAVSKGLYCEIKGGKITKSDVQKVEDRMRELVSKAIPFNKMIISLEEGKILFQQTGRIDKFNTIMYRQKEYVTIYEFDGLSDYFYGYMAPDSSFIKHFKLQHYSSGVIILFPDKSQPEVVPEFVEQPKLFNIFLEYKKWARILNAENLSDINKIVKDGNIGDFIRVSEALHEKKIAKIADMITSSEANNKFILISGPSSSGKTTFAKRLGIQLKVNGANPITIGLDDYFLSRDQTTIDENGEKDYESINAIDLQLFHKHLEQLMNGMDVEIPIYNFDRGRRENIGRKLKLCENDVLVIEGIHGLNEELTKNISRQYKFKIYVSALTSINIDWYNRVPSGDIRLLRRIVRDNMCRSIGPLLTFKMWSSVRKGENKNIFPFQEEADVVFNSSLPYELSVLKPYAIPLLTGINSDCEEYSEAVRLIEFLNYILPTGHEDVPDNSILREFVGDSCFY